MVIDKLINAKEVKNVSGITKSPQYRLNDKWMKNMYVFSDCNETRKKNNLSTRYSGICMLENLDIVLHLTYSGFSAHYRFLTISNQGLFFCIFMAKSSYKKTANTFNHCTIDIPMNCLLLDVL